MTRSNQHYEQWRPLNPHEEITDEDLAREVKEREQEQARSLVKGGRKQAKGKN